MTWERHPTDGGRGDWLRENMAAQVRVLQDVRERTGHSFPSLASVSLGNSPAMADAVVPVLAAWVDAVGVADIRGAIYQVLGTTERTRALMPELLRWWKAEPDALLRGQLASMLAHYLRDGQAAEVWEACRGEQFQGQSTLLARLARAPSVGREVEERILADLEGGRWTLGDLEAYARLPNARVRGWLLAQRETSPDQRVRALAERLAGRAPRRPDWLAPAAGEPERAAEVCSSELDLRHLDRELARMGRVLGVAARRLGAGKAFLAEAGEAQWFAGPFGTGEKGEALRLWLRAEDADVVEVVVTRAGEEDGPNAEENETPVS